MTTVNKHKTCPICKGRVVPKHRSPHDGPTGKKYCSYPCQNLAGQRRKIAKDPEKWRKRNRAWREKNRVWYNQRAAGYRWRLKMDVLGHYGGDPPRCACCREDEPRFLCLDHVGGRGRIHIQRLVRKLALKERRGMTSGGNPRGTQRAILGGSRLYMLLRTAGYPKRPRLRVLCYNCNMALGCFGRCPHNTKGMRPKTDIVYILSRGHY